jgi:hypothetical protein
MLRYAAVALPTSNSSGYVTGISGRTGEVYATTDGSLLLRSAGGAFAEVLGAGLSYGAGVYVAGDGSVFPAGQRQLGVCRSACDLGTSYSYTPVDISLTVKAVCGDSATNVYAAIEDSSNTARLWHYDGNMWASAVGNLGIDYPRSCAMLPDHTVAVAGQTKVVFYLNGLTIPEQAATVPPLTQSEADFQQWYGLGATATKLFAVGQSRRISMRTAPDMWSLTTFSGASDALYAIGAVSETEVYAGGSHSGNTAVRFFNGSNWSNGPELPTINHVRTIFVASPAEIFFGGTDGNGKPAIDKAFR